MNELKNIDKTKSNGLKILLIFMLIPVVLVVLIFYLIQKKHITSPHQLACSSFKVALKQKTVPLYVSESEFNIQTDEMCRCFASVNPSNASINQLILDKCAKETISNWALPPKFFKNENSELCFKKEIYNEIILPSIIEEQNSLFSEGIFRNDLFDYLKKENREKKQKYKNFLNSCLNS